MAQCIICGGKILLDENDNNVFSPVYCETCIENMRDKMMSPYEYAKMKGVDLPEE